MLTLAGKNKTGSPWAVFVRKAATGAALVVVVLLVVWFLRPGIVLPIVLLLVLVGGLTAATLAWAYRIERARRRFTGRYRRTRRALVRMRDDFPGMVFRYRLDAARTMESISEGCLALTGYRAAELLGAGSVRYTQLIHPADLQQVADAVDRAILHNEPYRVTYRLTTRAGIERWASEQGRAVWTRRRNEPSVEGFAMDVTLQVTTERALQQSVSDYHELVHHANSVIIRIDSSARITFFNELAETLFGYREEELLGRNVIGTVFPDDEDTRRDFNDIIGRLWMKLDLRLRYQSEHLSRAGQLLWVSWTCRPLMAEDESVTEIFCVGQNITERVRAEEASRLQGEITVHMNEGVCLIRAAENLIIYANPKLCEMLGVDAANLVNHPVGALSLRDPRSPGAAASIVELAGQATRWSGESCHTRSDGTDIWCRTSLSTFDHPEQGRLWVAVFEDVTKRRLAEQQVRRYERRLRTMAAELFLTEERERRRLAVQLHDGLGQLLALTSVKVRQVQQAETPEGVELLTEIRQLVDEARRTTSTLTFELSPPVLHDLGLPAAVEWLAEHMQQQHGLKVQVVNDGLARYTSESVRVVLFRAIRELLVNVVKYAGKKEATVRLACRGGRLEVRVEDEGAGFDPESAQQRSGPGGFGLFSIREQLAHIKGQLEIDSAPGRGTRVIITAPTE